MEAYYRQNISEISKKYDEFIQKMNEEKQLGQEANQMVPEAIVESDSLVETGDIQVFEDYVNDDRDSRNDYEVDEGQRISIIDITSPQTVEEIKEVKVETREWFNLPPLPFQNETSVRESFCAELDTPINHTAKLSSNDSEEEFPVSKQESKGNISTEALMNGNNVLFATTDGGQKIIKCAHVKILLEKLIDPDAFDIQFTQTILVSYPLYLNGHALLNYIIRVCRQAEEETKSTSTARSTAQLLRSVNFLKAWIEGYWDDFHSDKSLLESLQDFIQNMENAKLSLILKNALKKKLYSDFDTPSLLKHRTASTDTLGSFKIKSKSPQTAVPSEINSLGDLDAYEVAKELTLIESEIFNSIKPREFLDCSWMKENRESLSPNIIRMIRWSNHVVYWLVAEIVRVKDNVKTRALVMDKIIQIAMHLERLNNYNGIKEVLGALNSSPIYRLKKTKEVEKLT